MLAQRAKNWSLKRMAVTDRNVLRLGAFEILFTDTPDRVAINEAVELARRFGAEQSPQFVNGILDRFLRETPDEADRRGARVGRRARSRSPRPWRSVGTQLKRQDRARRRRQLRNLFRSSRRDCQSDDDRPWRLFARFRQGLKKTSDLLNTDIRDLFKREGRLVDEEFLNELFAILVKTDMGTGPANEIRDRVQNEYRGRVVANGGSSGFHTGFPARTHGAGSGSRSRWPPSGPTVILVVGVNGSGKTTSIAKLAHMFIAQGQRVVLGAGDTFRAAAVEQLTIWSERIGAEIVTGKSGGDPASVAHRAVAQAVESRAEVCIIDTAGRLQTQVNLMQQLDKIRRVVGKQIPEAPHEVLLVLDATAGQNGISQAKGFSDAAGCTGIVLAKLDGTAKGGVVIPIRRQFELPVKYIGLGETAEDLALFDVDRFVEALFYDADAAGVHSRACSRDSLLSSFAMADRHLSRLRHRAGRQLRFLSQSLRDCHFVGLGGPGKDRNPCHWAKSDLVSAVEYKHCYWNPRRRRHLARVTVRANRGDD